MPVMNQRDREALAKEFAQNLNREVHLVVFTQDAPCAFCRETVEVATELSQLSPKIRLEVLDFVRDQMRARELRIDKIPAIAVIGMKDYGIRFYGVPSGFELKSLVGAMIDVSKGESGLSQKSKDTLRNIDKAVHIQVFVTPTCPICPSAVRLAHRLAIETDMIWADMVEANEFIPLVQKYRVVSVPKIIINERSEITGAITEDLLVSHIMNSISHPEPLQPR